MTWGELKYHLNSLPVEVLRQPALFYDVYFGREFPILAMDNKSALDGEDGEEIILIGNREHAR